MDSPHPHASRFSGHGHAEAPRKKEDIQQMAWARAQGTKKGEELGAKARSRAGRAQSKCFSLRAQGALGPHQELPRKG